MKVPKGKYTDLTPTVLALLVHLHGPENMASDAFVFNLHVFGQSTGEAFLLKEKLPLELCSDMNQV